ncbi:heterodisulfide reductase-related iron-sulfur binding cluster [Desulfococcaceae bacterium HSG9]|nr:heterodisulfide reductase-related iron-sulfur binding cluster [Desulfococcaceae bacterium HSG9]
MDKAERLMRKVVDACTDCDCCRYIMDTSCLFFPEIYKLWDREKETGEEITPSELRHLADLCNYCALCPCPDIRDDIINAKTLFIDRDGLAPYIRTLEDVERVGKLCGAIPRLSNFFLQNKRTGRLIKKAVGINPKRKLPVFPKENFPSWAKRMALHEKAPLENKRKVAYFAGCTARYLFPNVPKAAIDVLKRNRVAVYYPEQNCCGMPSMLEGDRKLTLTFAERTVSYLAEVVADGYDVVCSCPTCGYMLKNVLREGAYYSKAYQNLVGGDERHIIIPETVKAEDTSGGSVKEKSLRTLDKSIYGKILKDDGYFSSIDPLKRIRVAENIYDLGEYLLDMHRNGELDTLLGPVPGKTVYYPPCHLREQGIGMPYPELLALIPEISMDNFQSTFYCCGIAGIMGFKKDFHKASIQMGSRLTAKIKRLAPDFLTTDCLSCRLQFNQMTAYTVHHPIEIISKSYNNGLA